MLPWTLGTAEVCGAGGVSLRLICFLPYASQLVSMSCLLSEQLVPDHSLSLAWLALSAFLFLIFTNDIFFFLIAEFCCIHSNTLLFKNQCSSFLFSQLSLWSLQT